MGALTQQSPLRLMLGGDLRSFGLDAAPGQSGQHSVEGGVRSTPHGFAERADPTAEMQVDKTVAKVIRLLAARRIAACPRAPGERGA